MSQLVDMRSSRDFGRWGGPNKLMEGYLQWNQTDDAEEFRESGATSDFANYMSDKVTKRLMWGYGEVTSAWRQYTTSYTVPDFKPISFVRLTEMQGLLGVGEGGEYKDSQISEIVGPSLTVDTFGRLFSLTRRAIINDDLNQLRDRPAAMGRAAARTVNRSVVAVVEANDNAYDGTAVFSTTHNNLLTEALSEQALQDAITKLRLQSDPNGLRIGLTPRWLLIPAQLEFTARRILNSGVIYQPGTGVGSANVVQGIVDYIVDEYLTDPNDWYLLADPNEAPLVAVGLLNGKDTPDVFLRDQGMRNVLGGSDPYSMEFDEIVWKIRHDWGVAVMDWRGGCKSAVA